LHILKDGTQTCTAAIPFAQGITLPDNKTIILGTNSDVTIQYDETTNDSLEIAANVEGAALGIVLKADQGDDAGDEWKLNIADGGTLTLGNDIASAGSYVTHLTITPNSTVSNSTTAVAGNLTVGGDLTLGSGAVITEAELEMLDGITAGTVSASKAMVVDANKDITGGRNLTISGELDAATLDVSGDVDIDGTLETDALSIASTAVTATAAELNYSDTGAAVGTVVASKVVTADANKDVASFRNITLTGELDAGSLDVSGDADIDGTLEADAMTLNGTAITATATLDTGISNNNVPKFTSGVADDDFLRVSGTAIEGRSAAEVLSDIGASAVAGSSSIVTTGALNAGSITSGFGAIDNGSSAITTTGVITGGTLEATTDTAAGDNAAIGYTAAEGLILTGQGSTNDVTIKNDADADVLEIPTGTTNVTVVGNMTAGGTVSGAHALSHRNIIINGSQIVAQRATSATGKTASGYYTCDRWQQLISSAGTWTFTQDTSVPSGEGFAYSYKWDCTTADGSLAAGDYLIHRQNIEGQNLQQLAYGVSGAKSVTLSFWVKSNKTGTYVCELRKGDDAKHIGRTYAISLANTWEYKTVTFTGDTASALVNTNATGIKVHFWLGAGSSYTSGTLPSSWASNTTANQAAGQTVNLADSTSNEWLITGIQMELGSQSTPFEHRSYGEELAACQRYTYVYNSQKIGGEKSLCNLAKWSNGTAYGSFSFPMEMRTAPSATIYNKTEFYVYIAGSVGQVSGSDTFGVANQTTDIGEVYIECGEGSSGQAGFMRKAGSASGTSSGYIVLDAEL